MADLPQEGSHEVSVDRRRFVQGVGAAGVLGAAGLLAFKQPAEAATMGQRRPEQVPPWARSRTPPGPDEFPKPPGLQPLGQLDARFPVTYETSVPEAMRLVTQYFAALSRRDLEGLARTLHFPFAIIEGTEPIVVESASELIDHPPPTLDPTGEGQSRIQAGSYDLLERLELHLFCLVGAALSLSFTRYTPDGHKLLVCDGIYGVTNNDGKWGIELVSTMYTPVDYLETTYEGTELAAIRLARDGMLRYTNRREKRLKTPEPFYGRSASLWFGYGPRARAGDARAGRPMAGWRTKGIKSRLNISERTPETPEPPFEPDPEFPQFSVDYNFAQFMDWAGGGVGQWDNTLTRPDEPRVIHATVDKAHTREGYNRYTADGTLISETRSLGILVYKDGRWGSGGGILQVTFHDRTNSVGS